MTENCLCLFDVDGTLTLPRQKIMAHVTECLRKLNEKAKVALVGGSDLKKIAEQMGEGLQVVEAYDYVFAENGLVAYKKGELIGKENILKHMGEEKLQTFINFCLEYMSKLKLPAKRGNFIEFRAGLINVCPVGRSCSQEERDEFSEYDKIHRVREKFVKVLLEKFPENGLIYSIGGQISFDCFPIGWDKTFCLKYLLKENFSKILFFGDKTSKGGNDFEIFNHPEVVGHTVNSPEDTVQQLNQIFNL